MLSERQKLKQLCGFPYTGLEKEVLSLVSCSCAHTHYLVVSFRFQIEDVIEMRAQSVSVVNHNYYDLLYCFHMSRGNFKKGAGGRERGGVREEGREGGRGLYMYMYM